MKIIVVGGSGLIGSKVVTMLTRQGHDVVAASRRSGVDAVTGEGLAEALSGAAVAVDVANSPSFEDAAVMKFFKTSTHNLLAGEAAAGVGHHVMLSVVGTERGTALNGTVEIGGPEPFYLDGIIQRVLGPRNDPREVIADPHARYFGAELSERSLLPGEEAELGEIRFDEWLGHTPRPMADVTVDGEVGRVEVPVAHAGQGA